MFSSTLCTDRAQDVCDIASSGHVWSRIRGSVVGLWGLGSGAGGAGTLEGRMPVNCPCGGGGGGGSSVALAGPGESWANTHCGEVAVGACN